MTSIIVFVVLIGTFYRYQESQGKKAQSDSTDAVKEEEPDDVQGNSDLDDVAAQEDDLTSIGHGACGHSPD